MANDWLTRWALKRACGDAGRAGGVRLLLLDGEGSVKDLGPFSKAELEGLAWAVGVAYRTSPVRYDRARLAALRGAAHRLVVGLRKS